MPLGTKYFYICKLQYNHQIILKIRVERPCIVIIFSKVGHPSDSGLMQGTGEDTEKLEYMNGMNHLFLKKRKMSLHLYLMGDKNGPIGFFNKRKPEKVKKASSFI